MIADPESRTRTMTGADMVLECLEREGVEVIFGYPGGANLPIYQHLPNHPNLRHILVRHEQGAAHMADGYARACGRPGVVFATSGPGALNTITGLATAFMDSVPMVVITGQVASTVVGRDAFQESDVIGCSQPGAKHNYLVTRVRDLPRVIKEAFQIASTGRPGPVLIDVCKDVQQADWPDPVWPESVELAGYRPAFAPAMTQGEKGAQPTGTTLLGVGAFPVNHPLALHMTGFMGTGWNIKAVQNADLLMMVGMRVDDRVTAKLADWPPKAETFIHVDIDRSEMGKNVRPHLEVVADAKTALAAMLPYVQEPAAERRRPWLTQVDRWREEHPLKYTQSNGHLQPQDVMIEMYRRCADD